MKVLKVERESDKYAHMGYDIIDVPLELKPRFLLDLQAAIMNICGISISDVTKFITYEIVSQCYCGDRNPFSSNILTLGTKDTLAISDFFKPSMVPEELYTRPIFIHLDASVTGDRTGLSAVAVMGYTYKNDYNVEEGKVMPTKKMLYKQLFSIGIQCPPNAEISFQKTRDFIYYLRYVLGWNIKGTSTDGFQSVDTRQQLESAGFESKLVSLDRTPDGYMMLRAALGEKRISLLSDMPELETELIRLERDNMTGKIDHPPIDGCLSGDTEIILIDSKNIRYNIKIQDITENYEYYKDYRVISADSDRNIKLCKFINPRVTKYVDSYLKIIFDDNSIVECTHNHPILCGINCVYKNAEDIEPGNFVVSIDSNMNLYYKIVTDIHEVKISKSIPVYDIEVPDTSNFALSNGVIVHNSKDISDSLCGALYNASLHEKDLDLYTIDHADILVDTNNDADAIDYKDKLLSGLTSTVYAIHKDNDDNLVDTSVSMDNTSKEKIKAVAAEILAQMNSELDTELAKAKKLQSSNVSPSTNIDPNEEKRRKFLEARKRFNNTSARSIDNSDYLQRMQDLKDGFIL